MGPAATDDSGPLAALAVREGGGVGVLVYAACLVLAPDALFLRTVGAGRQFPAGGAAHTTGRAAVHIRHHGHGSVLGALGSVQVPMARGGGVGTLHNVGCAGPETGATRVQGGAGRPALRWTLLQRGDRLQVM